MAWIDNLRKIFINEDTKREENQLVKIEKISFESVFVKLNEKIRNDDNENNKLKSEIVKRINDFSVGINSAIDNLQSVDLSKRKEHEKIKAVVQENFSLYIANLRRLNENLKNAEKLELKEYIKKISDIFNEFDSSSNLAYEKATILIGKELAITKELIKSFKKDFISHMEDNRGFFKSIESTAKLKDILDEIKQSELFESEFEKIIKENDEKLKDIEIEINNLRENINLLKRSDNYIKDMQRKDEQARKLIEFENKLRSIKQQIDFKKLAKVYHRDAKKNSLISSYVNNFISTFQNDSSLDILPLVRDAQGIDLTELETIQLEFIALNKKTITPREEELLSLEEKIKNLINQTSSINENIQDEKRKKEKLLSKKEKLILEAKEAVKSVFPNLELE